MRNASRSDQSPLPPFAVSRTTCHSNRRHAVMRNANRSLQCLHMPEMATLSWRFMIDRRRRLFINDEGRAADRNCIDSLMSTYHRLRRAVTPKARIHGALATVFLAMRSQCSAYCRKMNQPVRRRHHCPTRRNESRQRSAQWSETWGLLALAHQRCNHQFVSKMKRQSHQSHRKQGQRCSVVAMDGSPFGPLDPLILLGESMLRGAISDRACR
jgi:hypothetical protein